MAELVGYQLVADDGTVVESWGGTFGEAPGVPAVLHLPNGDQVYCAAVDSKHGDWTLREWLEDAPAPTGSDVDDERNRRTALPLGIVLTGPDRTFQVNMDDIALRNMSGLATAAVLAKVLGSSATVDFIAYDNSTVTLSPDDLISLGLQVQTRITALTFKGRALKDISPIPADFAADSYWE